MDIQGFSEKRKRGRPPGIGPTRADRIGADIRQQILSGRLRIGERLPTEQELARQYHVAVMTLRKAQQPLVDEGLIRKERRRGTFVCDLAAKHRRIQLVCGLGLIPEGAGIEMVSPFFQHSIRFCHAAAKAHGLAMDTVWQWSHAPAAARPVRANLAADAVSGYIFLGCAAGHPLLERAQREGAHYVSLGKTYEAERTIWFDMAEAAGLAWEGLRRQIVSRNLPVVAVSMQGDEGGAEALAKLVPGGIQHLRVSNHYSLMDCEQWGYRFVSKICADDNRATAFVFFDDILARGGTRALLQAGWNAGQCPVAVVSGKQELAPYGLPASYVTHDTERESRWAVEMLLAQIEGDATGAASRRSPFALAAEFESGQPGGGGVSHGVVDISEHMVALK